MQEIEHSNPLEEDDIISALETYDRQYYNFKIDDIEKLTDIRIERNKRNYRPQSQHLQIARATQQILYPNGEWRNAKGRPKNRGTKEKIIKTYINKNPYSSPTEIARELGVSRTTVYKYIKEC